jgi:hypothetical protein
LRSTTRLLDDLVRIPGTSIRFGIDPVLSLIPGAGDAASGLLSLYAMTLAAQLGAPPSVVLRMMANTLVDILLGLFPGLGDVVDVVWKSNRRNLLLLEHYLAQPTQTHHRSKAVLIATVGTAFAIITFVIIAVGVLTAFVAVSLASLLGLPLV